MLEEVTEPLPIIEKGKYDHVGNPPKLLLIKCEKE
jgi:hypothetical protein